MVFNHAPSGYLCPFCENVCGRSEYPLEVLHRYEQVLVKVNPFWGLDSPGRVLVFPVEHYENVYDLPAELGAPLQRGVQDAALALKRALGSDGVSIRQHNEPAGGQDVWHFHIHVLPRRRGDQADESEARLAHPHDLALLAERLRAVWPTPGPPLRN